MKRLRKICSRGHVFYKSSQCPVCPICWPGRYRPKLQSDFPEGLAAPALRALAHAKIHKLKELSQHTEKEIGALHGIGPHALSLLKTEMKKKDVKFKQS